MHKPWSFHRVLDTLSKAWDLLPGSLIRIGLDGLIHNLQEEWGGVCKAPVWGSVSIVFANTHNQYLSIRNSYEAKLQQIETLSEDFPLTLVNPSKHPFCKPLQCVPLYCESSKVATEIQLKAY